MIAQTQNDTSTLRSGDSIEHFLALLGRAGAHLREAAEILCRLVANDPKTISKIREKAPTIPAGLLTNLLRVGEHSLHPDLLLNSCIAYRKLRLLPYSTQERVLSQSVVDLVVDVEKGDTLRVPLVELTGPQSSQIISRDGIRSRDEQRAWLKLKQVTATPQRAESAGWFVKKDRLVVTRACEMSKAQLLAALGEITS